MFSETSSEEETSDTDVAPAPGSRVVEGSVEENPATQYPPLPRRQVTFKESLKRDATVHLASIEGLPELVAGELKEISAPAPAGPTNPPVDPLQVTARQIADFLCRRREAQRILAKRRTARLIAMTTISPYAGSINLTQQTSIALHQKGCKTLPIKFDRLAKLLPSFLAALNLCGTMCQWTDILMILDDNRTPRHMITHHGSLTQDNVNVGVVKQRTNAAKPQPPAAGDITEAEAQTIIKSKMLFNCLRESLMNTYLTSLTVILPMMEEDRPKFLDYMIPQTHVTTVLSTCDLLEDINTLDFKKHRYDVLKLQAAFNSFVAQLTMNKAEPSELNQMMYLLQVYKMNTLNETFLRHVDNLESDWSRGIIAMPAELRMKVETYINTLIRNKQWKSTCPVPSQPTALVTDETAKPRNLR